MNCLGDCRELPRVIAERRANALCFSRQRLSGIISRTVFFYSFLQVYKPILSRKNAKVNSFQNTRRAKMPQSQSPCGFEALFQIPIIPLVSSKGKELKKPRLARGCFAPAGATRALPLTRPPGALAVWQRVQVSLAPSGGQCVALTPSRDGSYFLHYVPKISTL